MKTWYNGNQKDDDMNIISTQKEQLAQKLFDKRKHMIYYMSCGISIISMRVWVGI